MAVLLSASSAAQTPTFRAGTTLVEFTVVALDGDGRPVTDLRQDEIVVTENGQRRELSFFRFDGGGDERKTERLPAPLFSNRSEHTAGPPRNITAIVLDGIHTRPSAQNLARTQLLRYLQTIAPDTRVAVYHAGRRMTVLHDFTDDVASLRARMEQVLAGPRDSAEIEQDQFAEGVTPAEASGILQQALADMTAIEEGYQESVDDLKRNLSLASLEALGNHLAGIPGRKSLVWIGAGMPINTSYRGYLRSHDRQIRATAQRLASHGITVYPVDAQGLLPPDMGTTSTAKGSSRGQRPPPRQAGLPDQRLWASMDLMAGVTGGRVSKNTNDLADGVKVAAADHRGTYTVGFYAAGTPDGTWHRLDVNAKRRGVRLSHRQGYLSEAPEEQPLEWSREQWRSAIANPLGSTVIRLDARFEPVEGAEAGTYSLLMLISPDALHFREVGDRRAADVSVVIAEKRRSGAFDYRVGAAEFTLPKGTDTDGSFIRYMDRWKVGPETSIIRVIVRDRLTGRYGTLDIALTAR